MSQQRGPTLTPSARPSVSIFRIHPTVTPICSAACVTVSNADVFSMPVL